MTKRVFWAVLVVGFLGLASAEATIKVGALYNVTGNMSSIDGPGLNGIHLAAEEINAKVPFAIAGATLPDLPDRIGDYAFMVPFGDNAQAYAVADYAYHTLEARTVSMLYDRVYDFTLALHKFFQECWASLAGANSLLSDDA